jgi:hypothetical protein
LAVIAGYPGALTPARCVQDGTIVVADNAALFKDFDGMRDYLARVRGSGLYETRTLKTTLEYRCFPGQELLDCSEEGQLRCCGSLTLLSPVWQGRYAGCDGGERLPTGRGGAGYDFQ